MLSELLAKIVEALPGIEIIDRSTVNAYDDERVARAIEATGRNDAHLLDIAPTVLEILGIDVPSDMRGHALSVVERTSA